MPNDLPPWTAVSQQVQRWADWLEHTTRISVADSTYREYTGLFRRCIQHGIGHIRMTALTAQHIQKLYSRMLDEGRSPATVRHVHALLHQALQHTGRVRWQEVRPPKAKRTKVVALDPEQVGTILETTRGTRLEALWVLIAYTGLRLSEALGLRWQDVDLDRKQVRINKVLQTKGLRVLKDPKTEESRRTLRVSERVVEALRGWKLNQITERLRAGERWADEAGLVFTTRQGRPISVSSLHENVWKPLLTRAGAPRIRIHDLRTSWRRCY
ncbi:MAG: tyrosine-type recombinase/integrase [Chloroflexi bacterium]|nr:tyrosine-type recombinase/integrase [Chloroflexota bacterium]